MTISGHELARFYAAVLRSSGATQANADSVARALVWADERGRETHGMERLVTYSKRIRGGSINGRVRPRIRRDGGGTAVVDAGGGFGHVAMFRAIELACGTAATHGVAAVGVRNSNHFGCAGYYAHAGATRGYITLVISNASPSAGPPGHPTVGNNPMSFGAPTPGPEPLVIDLALSVVSRQQIRRRAAAGLNIPLGWALDAFGNPTRDAAAALDGSTLLIGGYKGFAMAIAFDYLAGVLTGSSYGSAVGNAFDVQRPQRLGHFLLVINPGSFAHPARLRARTRDFLSGVAGGDEDAAFRLPGRGSARTAAERAQSGIPVPESIVRSWSQLSRELSVKLPDKLLSGSQL